MLRRSVTWSQDGSFLRASEAAAGLREPICENEVIHSSPGKRLSLRPDSGHGSVLQEVSRSHLQCQRSHLPQRGSTSTHGSVVFCQLPPDGMRQNRSPSGPHAHESNQLMWMDESEVQGVHVRARPQLGAASPCVWVQPKQRVIHLLPDLRVLVE